MFTPQDIGVTIGFNRTVNQTALREKTDVAVRIGPIVREPAACRLQGWK